MSILIVYILALVVVALVCKYMRDLRESKEKADNIVRNNLLLRSMGTNEEDKAESLLRLMKQNETESLKELKEIVLSSTKVRELSVTEIRSLLRVISTHKELEAFKMSIHPDDTTFRHMELWISFYLRKRLDGIE